MFPYSETLRLSQSNPTPSSTNKVRNVIFFHISTSLKMGEPREEDALQFMNEVRIETLSSRGIDQGAFCGRRRSLQGFPFNYD